MEKRNFAFDKVNFILIAVSMLVVVLGFVLMSGSGSTDTHYDPDIFSTLRIKVAPVVCFVGFVTMIYAVARKPKDGDIKGKDNALARFAARTDRVSARKQ